MSPPTRGRVGSTRPPLVHVSSSQFFLLGNPYIWPRITMYTIFFPTVKVTRFRLTTTRALPLSFEQCRGWFSVRGFIIAYILYPSSAAR